MTNIGMPNECTGGQLCNVTPKGNMVLCKVMDNEGEEDSAYWGNSGAMGEETSFFEPINGKFKAESITWWHYA